MRSIIIKIIDAELDEDGRRFLDLVRHQDRHLDAILASRDGIVYAEINAEHADDILRVVVDNQLGHAERSRRFGRTGVSSAPPERQEDIYGLHAMTPATRKRWFVPESLVRRAATERGATIINLAAAALREWCEEGGFVPWRDPDWISQSAAAEDVGVPASTIHNAVRTGKLATWDDPDEPNPQRRTRVRRSEVRARWAKEI